MGDRIRFLLNRIAERLWIKPLVMCLLSIVGAFVAKIADSTEVGDLIPYINPDSIQTLLSIMSASMLTIATFAVASMVSAYASASNSATPRTFPLVISDDVSQNALSTFIGAFIFSIVSLIALQNGYYEKAGLFALFSLTLVVFVIVIYTFVRWMDQIARLGRLGSTIEKVEQATTSSLRRRRNTPTLRGASVNPLRENSQPVYSTSIGYVQRVDVADLQRQAEKLEAIITVDTLPGAFVAPGKILAYVTSDSGEIIEFDQDNISRAFRVGKERKFDEDPRFGLIVLSQIASRALSPAVNDPGTAIDIIGTFIRIFNIWCEPIVEEEERSLSYERVEVPEISLDDMLEDAFRAIARDGASLIEVAGRLQKAFESLALIGDIELRKVAKDHARKALARAEKSLVVPEDIELVRELSKFTNS